MHRRERRGFAGSGDMLLAKFLERGDISKTESTRRQAVILRFFHIASSVVRVGDWSSSNRASVWSIRVDDISRDMAGWSVGI